MAKDSYRLVRDRAPTGCCPACGQTVPDADLRVDLQTNTLSAGGKAIHIQPRTAELIHVLIERFPNYVPREVLISRVWVDDAVHRTVDAQGTKARTALKRLGYNLESTRGSGYRIAKDTGGTPAVVPALASFGRLQYVRPF